MDTVTRTSDAAPPTAGWWRRPLADLLDVILVAMAGLVVGGGVATAMMVDAGDDPWAGLAAALLGLAAGALAALVAWAWLLAVVGRGDLSPGSRILGLGASRALGAAGRHLMVVVVLWAGAATVAAAVEPWPAGPLGGAVATAAATAAALAAWGHGPWPRRLQVVGVAAVAGLLLTGAVPDRAPYPWELRQEAEAQVRATLEDDPAARRACDLAAGDGPVASHATEPCYDPDREWIVDRHPAVVTEQLTAVVADVAGAHEAVRVVDVRTGREVRLGTVAVATVVAQQDGCASLVVVGSWQPSTPVQADGACR